MLLDMKETGLCTYLPCYDGFAMMTERRIYERLGVVACH